jgi:hypothetical protein
VVVNLLTIRLGLNIAHELIHQPVMSDAVPCIVPGSIARFRTFSRFLSRAALILRMSHGLVELWINDACLLVLMALPR